MIIETPGLYKNVPIDDYHASKGISSTGIKLILESPKKYWYQYLSGEFKRDQSRRYTHFVIGQAVHTMTLEPDTFKERFYIGKKISRVSKAGKEEYAAMLQEANGKEILTEEEYKQASIMAKNIIDHSLFKKLKGENGCYEDSILWHDFDTGALLRTRPDYYNDFLIMDVKISKDASEHSFSKAIHEYGYHIQGAMACDGLTEETGRTYEHVVLFVVEEEPPHLVQPYLLKENLINAGRQLYKKGARIYRACLDNNLWQGYEEKIIDIDIPQWAHNQIIAGEAI